jgi:hypothetical protein
VIDSTVEMKEDEHLKVDPKVITANILDYMNKNVFYKGKDCPQGAKYNGSQGISILNASITQQTSDLIPPDL